MCVCVWWWWVGGGEDIGVEEMLGRVCEGMMVEGVMDQCICMPGRVCVDMVSAYMHVYVYMYMCMRMCMCMRM